MDNPRFLFFSFHLKLPQGNHFSKYNAAVAAVAAAAVDDNVCFCS